MDTKKVIGKLFRLALIQRKMMELDPYTMAETMAWNNTYLEQDLPENKDLQKRYKRLYKRAEKLV